MTVSCEPEVMEQIEKNYNGYRIFVLHYLYGMKSESEAYESFKNHVLYFTAQSNRLGVKNAQAYFSTKIMVGDPIDENRTSVEIDSSLVDELAEHTYRSSFYKECILLSTKDVPDDRFRDLIDKLAFHTFQIDNVLMPMGFVEVDFIEKRAYL